MSNLKLKTNFDLDKNLRSELDLLLYEFFENFESEATKKNYASDIMQFFEYYRENLALRSIKQLTRVHGVQYKKWLTESEYAPKSINRKLASCSSFCDFLMEKNILILNPFSSIRRPKQVVEAPTNDLTDVEVRDVMRLLMEAKGSSAPLHKAIIFLLFCTGIRKSELIHIKRKHFYSKDRRYFVHIKGKGGKTLEKWVAPECVQLIQDYLQWMDDNGRTVHPEDWLFQPTRNPLNGNLIKPLNPKSIDYIFKQYCQKAGVLKRVSVHSARASYIGSAIDGGADLYKIAQDVGHSSVKTTEEYNKRKRKFADSPVHHLGFLKEK